MRRQLISLVTLALAAAAGAVVVENTAGKLETNATDHSITSLAVTGTMDARDFKFIADSLTELTELDLSQVQIVAYQDSLKPLVGTFFSFPADELPASMLMGTGLTSITLPDSLKSIGQAALAGCTDLTAITLPEGLTTIGSYAFSGSGLTTVTLPEAVTTIGQGAWARCYGLTSATVNVAMVPDHAFMGDTLLSSVNLGNKVETIGKSAFNGCTALSGITLGDETALTTIGTEAFIGAGAQEIDLSSIASLKTLGNWAMASSQATAANLPQELDSLGQGAFFYAQNIEQVTLPQGINAIADFTFAGDSAVTGTVELPHGVETVGDYAFYNNSKVAVFTLPETVSYMGNWAMAGMTGLDTINAAPMVVPALGDSVWAGIQQSAVMLNTADNDIADLYGAADQWKEFHILRNYLMGDVNMDGIINITDVNTMVMHLLNEQVLVFDEFAADINQDGIINITDLNALVMMVLEGRQEYIRKAKGHKATPGNFTSDCITVGDLAIANGETREIELSLNNSRTYSAMQFDIDMPEGLVIVPGSLTSTSRNSGHTALLSSRNDRIMLLSSKGDAINGSEGAVLKMKVTATQNVYGDITISRPVFSTPQCETYVGSDTYALVSNTSGVNDMTAASSKVYAHDNIIVIEAQNSGKAQIAAMNGVAQDINVQAGHNEVEMPSGFYVVVLDGNSYKVAIQ